MKKLSFRLGLTGDAEITRAMKDLAATWNEAVKGVEAAGKELGKTWDAAKDTVKEVAGAAGATDKEVRAAARSIGFVTDEAIEKQVAAARSALETLKASGKLSAEEIERASEATEKQIARLYASIGKEAAEATRDVQAEADKIRADYAAMARAGDASADDLKAAHARMVKQLRDLEDETGKSVTRFGALRLGLRKLRGAVQEARAGFAGLADAGRGLRDSVGGLGQAVGTVGTRLAVAVGAATAAGVAVVSVANATAEHAKALKLYARQTGLSEESLQRFAYAAKTVGVDMQDAAEAYRDFVVRVGEARAGETTAVENFRSLGITPEDIERLSPDALFDRWVEGLSRLDRASRTFRVDELLSDAGTRLLPLIDKGVEGIRRLEAEGARYVLTRQELTDAAAYDEAARKVGMALESVRRSIGVVFMPALAEGAKALSVFVAENRAAILGFVRLKWDRVASVVRDVVALAQGRDVDVRNGWLIGLRDQVVAFGVAVDGAINGFVVPAFRLLFGTLDVVAGAMNALFGTNLDGQALAIGLVVLKVSGAFGLLAGTVSVLTNAFIFARTVVLGLRSAMIALGVASLFNPIGLAAMAIAAAVALIVLNWTRLKRALGMETEAEKAADAVDGLSESVEGQVEALDGLRGLREQIAAQTADLAAQEKDLTAAMDGGADAMDRAGDSAARAVQSMDLGPKVQKATETLKGAYEDLQVVIDDSLARQLEAADAMGEAQQRAMLQAPERRRLEEQARIVEQVERRKVAAVNQWASRATAAVRQYYGTALTLARRDKDKVVELQGQMLDDLAEINARRESELKATVDRLIEEEERHRQAAVDAARDGAEKIKGITQSLRDLELDLLSPKKAYRAREEDIADKKAEAMALLAAGEFERARDLAEEIARDAIDNAGTVDTTRKTVAQARASAEWAQSLIDQATAGLVAAEQQAAAGAAVQAQEVQAQLALVQQQVAQIRQAQALLSGMRVTMDVTPALQGLAAVEQGLAATRVAATQTVAVFDRLAESAARAAAAMKGARSGGGGGAEDAPGYAGGGPIVGPGTGTSDSIIARLSNGEYVIRAAAVRRYGRALLDAINGGKFRLPAFRLGGLVDMAAGLADRLAPLSMPALPEVAGPGGLSGRPVVLNIGGESFALAAGPREADRLERMPSNGLGRRPRHAHMGRTTG